eukprot:scaffold26327_cov44-Prasinocladus_malaysianus.AAC.1
MPAPTCPVRVVKELSLTRGELPICHGQHLWRGGRAYGPHGEVLEGRRLVLAVDTHTLRRQVRDFPPRTAYHSAASYGMATIA